MEEARSWNDRYNPARCAQHLTARRKKAAQRQKLRYRKNPQRMREAGRKYRATHREAERARNRRYYAEHREQKQEQLRRWKAANRAYVNKKAREWQRARRTDPEWRAAQNAAALAALRRKWDTDPAGMRERERAKGKRASDELSDSYIRRLIANNVKCRRGDVPENLLPVVRVHLQLRRLIGERKHAQHQGTTN